MVRTPRSCRCAAGPMPDLISTAGVSRQPPPTTTVGAWKTNPSIVCTPVTAGSRPSSCVKSTRDTSVSVRTCRLRKCSRQSGSMMPDSTWTESEHTFSFVCRGHQRFSAPVNAERRSPSLLRVGAPRKTALRFVGRTRSCALLASSTSAGSDAVSRWCSRCGGWRGPISSSHISSKSSTTASLSPSRSMRRDLRRSDQAGMVKA